MAKTEWPFRIADFSHIGAGWGVDVAIQTIIRWSTAVRYQPRYTLWTCHELTVDQVQSVL